MIGGPSPRLGNRMSQHTFSQIPAVHMARSQFDRSHAAKDTFNFDYLVPIFVDEIIPGDTCNLSLNTFARLATQIVPVMDNMYLDFFFFFVPNRLVWSNWEKMCGAQDAPGDSTDYIFPTVSSPKNGTGLPIGFQLGDLYDHFGLPINVVGTDLLTINNLPARAYNLIWNEWFRDQNLQDPAQVDLDDGPDDYANYQLLSRNKRHDYFTSSLPFLQKGPAVELPLGSSAPVVSDNSSLSPTFSSIGGAFVSGIQAGGGSDGHLAWQSVPGAAHNPMVWDDPHLLADLSSATAATINQLREAFQMQALFELDARGGTRYVEILLAHFNVTSPDFRLQRPEFLGGGSQKISSHPVPQTSATSAGQPQGNLAAFATSASNGHIGFTKSFVEHGYVIGLVSARADITYQQGVNKMWLKSTRYDLFWPKLQELGEQPVLNMEIYAQGDSTVDPLPFGYQERYAEYRFKPSEIRGQFRSTATDPIDYWHLAEDFGSAPALNNEFIISNTPIARVVYDDTAPQLLIDMWFNYKQARPMMTYSTPVSLGRF